MTRMDDLEKHRELMDNLNSLGRRIAGHVLVGAAVPQEWLREFELTDRAVADVARRLWPTT